MMIADRRHFPRQNEAAIIQVFLGVDDSKESNRGRDLISAKMCNQSKEGLYFEIDRDLQPGLTISMRMAEPDSQHPEAPYYVHDGQVMWIKKIDNKSPRFGVGVKILRKVVRADVLNSRFG